MKRSPADGSLPENCSTRCRKRPLPYSPTQMGLPEDPGDPAGVAALVDQMIESQRARLMELARRIDPSLSADDLMQPHDHPKVAKHPDFQFEDGILAGYLAVRAALRARR